MCLLGELRDRTEGVTALLHNRGCFAYTLIHFINIDYNRNRWATPTLIHLSYYGLMFCLPTSALVTQQNNLNLDVNKERMVNM